MGTPPVAAHISPTACCPSTYRVQKTSWSLLGVRSFYRCLYASSSSSQSLRSVRPPVRYPLSPSHCCSYLLESSSPTRRPDGPAGRKTPGRWLCCLAACVRACLDRRREGKGREGKGRQDRGCGCGCGGGGPTDYIQQQWQRKRLLWRRRRRQQQQLTEGGGRERRRNNTRSVSQRREAIASCGKQNFTVCRAQTDEFVLCVKCSKLMSAPSDGILDR